MPGGRGAGSGFGCSEETKAEQEVGQSTWWRAARGSRRPSTAEGECYVDGAGSERSWCESPYGLEEISPANRAVRREVNLQKASLAKPKAQPGKPKAWRRPFWHLALACCGDVSIGKEGPSPAQQQQRQQQAKDRAESPVGDERAADMASPAVLRVTRRMSLPTAQATRDERSAVVDKARALLQLGMITESEYLEVVVADRLYRIHTETTPGTRAHRKALKKQQRLAMLASSAALSRAASAPAAIPTDPEERDPITLEPLGLYRLTFRFEADGSVASLPSDITPRPISAIGLTGRAVTYNTDSLARYLIESGHFVEPTSRAPLGPQDVAALSEQLERMGLYSARDQLAEAYARPDTFKAQRERMDLLEGLDRCVGDVVSEMLGLIEGAASGPPDGSARRRAAQRNASSGGSEATNDAANAGGSALWPEVRLCVQFAHFDHFFALLLQADAAYALQCLDQYTRHLRGPPNRRTRDAGGLLSACLSHLREKEKEAALARRRQMRRSQSVP